MRILALMTLIFGLVAAPVNDAEARRLGGSKSLGKRQNTHQVQPQQQPGGVANQAAGAGRKGMMGGMLGGLLAGGLLGALFFGGAFEGLQLMDILLFAGIAFLLLKLLRGKAAAMQRQATAGGPGFDANPVAGGQVGGAAPAPTAPGEVPLRLPPGFDAESFLDTARAHFRELQQAWNDYDMDKVREFCSPALYAQLAAQRAENAGAEHTEVEFLDAQIVRADSNAHLAELSVLYTGRTRDTAEDTEEDVNEVWHLERDLRQPGAPWLIVGIQQREQD